MNQMNVQIDEIIARKLCGEHSEEDDRMLQDWINSDPANKTQYDSVVRQWNEVDKLLTASHFDTEAAWSKVAQQTVNKTSVKQPTVIPLLRRVAAVAAILLVAVVVYKTTGRESTIVVVAEGGNKEVVLPDDTHVTLHQGSKLSYGKTLAGKERRVALAGEAYFKVHRDEQHPFIIEAQAGEVQVLGTAFDLKCSEEAATVSVVEGKVRFSAARDKNNFVILTRNQKAQLANNKISQSLVEDENFLYWKTGVLVFHKRQLSLVARQLSELFDARIELDPKLSETERMFLVDAEFKQVGLEAMLTDICSVSGFKWTKQADGHYNITGR